MLRHSHREGRNWCTLEERKHMPFGSCSSIMCIVACFFFRPNPMNHKENVFCKCSFIFDIYLTFTIDSIALVAFMWCQMHSKCYTTKWKHDRAGRTNKKPQLKTIGILLKLFSVLILLWEAKPWTHIRLSSHDDLFIHSSIVFRRCRRCSDHQTNLSRIDGQFFSIKSMGRWQWINERA